MEGLAATITKSDGCQPPVMLSRTVKPEGTPVMPPSRPWIDSRCCTVCIITSLIATTPLRSWLSEIWKICRSASSSRSNASMVGS